MSAQQDESDDERNERSAKTLRSLRSQPSFCDAELLTEDASISVHRAVLSTVSPVFKNLFLKLPPGVHVLALNDATTEALQIVVDHAYGCPVLNKPSCISLSLSKELMRLAKRFKMDKLLSVAAVHAVRDTDPHQLLDMYRLLLPLNVSEAKALLVDEIALRFRSETVAEFSCQFLCSVLSSPNLHANESSMLEAVLIWAGAQKEKSSFELQKLLELVSFARMTVSEVIELLDKHYLPPSLALAKKIAEFSLRAYKCEYSLYKWKCESNEKKFLSYRPKNKTIVIDSKKLSCTVYALPLQISKKNLLQEQKYFSITAWGLALTLRICRSEKMVCLGVRIDRQLSSRARYRPCLASRVRNYVLRIDVALKYQPGLAGSEIAEAGVWALADISDSGHIHPTLPICTIEKILTYAPWIALGVNISFTAISYEDEKPKTVN